MVPECMSGQDRHKTQSPSLFQINKWWLKCIQPAHACPTVSWYLYTTDMELHCMCVLHFEMSGALCH